MPEIRQAHIQLQLYQNKSLISQVIFIHVELYTILNDSKQLHNNKRVLYTILNVSKQLQNNKWENNNQILL